MNWVLKDELTFLWGCWSENGRQKGTACASALRQRQMELKSAWVGEGGAEANGVGLDGRLKGSEVELLFTGGASMWHTLGVLF